MISQSRRAHPIQDMVVFEDPGEYMLGKERDVKVTGRRPEQAETIILVPDEESDNGRQLSVGNHSESAVRIKTENGQQLSFLQPGESQVYYFEGGKFLEYYDTQFGKEPQNGVIEGMRFAFDPYAQYMSFGGLAAFPDNDLNLRMAAVPLIGRASSSDYLFEDGWHYKGTIDWKDGSKTSIDTENGVLPSEFAADVYGEGSAPYYDSYLYDNGPDTGTFLANSDYETDSDATPYGRRADALWVVHVYKDLPEDMDNDGLYKVEMQAEKFPGMPWGALDDDAFGVMKHRLVSIESWGTGPELADWNSRPNLYNFFLYDMDNLVTTGADVSRDPDTGDIHVASQINSGPRPAPIGECRALADRSREYGKAGVACDVGEWDMSQVTGLGYAFSDDFSQDLSDWCVPNIDSEPYRFVPYGFPQEFQPDWGAECS